MGQARDEAGNIWETDANGKAIRLITPAQRQQVGPITIGTPNPAAQYDVPQAAAQTTKAQADAQSAVAEAPYAGAAASTQGVPAGYMWNRDGTGVIPIPGYENPEETDPQALKNAEIKKFLASDNMLGEIARARGMIDWSNTGNVFGSDTFSSVPFVGQGSTDLSGVIDTLKANLSFDELSAMRTDPANKTGGALGNVTEQELKLLSSVVSSLNQKMSEQELRNSLAKIDLHYRRYRALLNGDDPRKEEVSERYGIIPDGADGSNKPPIGGELTSEGEMVNDPALRGVNAKVSDMIKSGRTEQEVKDYLNNVSPGLGDRSQNIGWWTDFIAQNPNEEVQVDLESVWQPAGGVSETLGDIGMSPVGAGVIGAADTATLGFLDNLTGNPDMTRAVMAGVQEENPGSYLTGQLLGGVTTGLGIESALARGGMTGIRGARAGDALFGAGYGAGLADDPDDSRIASALLGAGAGVAGGALGRGAARVGGRALEGVTDAGQQILNRAGVQMTPGQVLGGAAKSVEDRLAGLPFVGDAIVRRWQEGMQTFDKAAFDEMLEPIGGSTNGVIGALGVEAGQAARSKAYRDALDDVNLTADDVFEQEIRQALTQAGQLPDPMRANAETSLGMRIGNVIGEGGELSGRDFQQSLRGLRRDAKSFESQPFGYDAAQVTRAGEGALEGLVERQSPQTLPAYRAANKANMNVETIRNAVDRARNQGEVFTPAQLATSASQTARKFGNNQGTTNQPFYDLTRAGQEVLPSTIPDSGTAGRLLLPLAAAGLVGGGSYATSEGDTLERSGSGATGAVIAGLLAAAPYSPAARSSLQKVMMAERPDLMRQIGMRVIDDSEIAGLLAAPATVGYISQ